MQRFEAAYGRVLDALALIACALILGMTLMICADVFLRNVRIVPGLVGLEWANEISEAMLFLVTLLTAPWLLRRGQHIRVDPGFYNAEVSLVMNLDKYKALPAKAREYLDRQALAYEQQNDFWKTYNQNEAKRQAEAGIQTISFDAATSKTYVERAKEVGWANAIKSSPQYGEQLKKVLAK